MIVELTKKSDEFSVVLIQWPFIKDKVKDAVSQEIRRN